MRRFIVERPEDIIEVILMPHKEDGKYSFINLTKEHICKCKFNTIEEAIADMDKQMEQGNIERYTEY